MTLTRNGKPVTIEELQRIRIDGKWMSRPRCNDFTGNWSDLGPGQDHPPEPEASKPGPKGRHGKPKSGRVEAAEAERRQERQRLREIARRMLASGPVRLLDLAKEAGIPAAAIGRRCLGARIRTVSEKPGRTLAVEVMP